MAITTNGQADRLNKINSPEFKVMIKEIDEERKRNKSTEQEEDKQMITRSATSKNKVEVVFEKMKTRSQK